MKLEELYDIAESENIDIYAAALPLTKSMSIMDDDLNCYIGIDYDQIYTSSEEKPARRATGKTRWPLIR